MRKTVVVLAGLLALVAAAVPASASPARPGPLGCTHALLSRPAQGTQALQQLGDRLPQAAALTRRSSTSLAAELRRDPSAWLDRCGQGFYVDADVAQATTPDLTVPGTSVPPDQAFLLHSRPGSQRVLYLDFKGRVLSGTGWNDSFAAGADITAAPYDTDGDPSTFSATERAAVVAVFQRVAEDYAPFDLDVTTQDPGQAAIDRTDASDTSFGSRALITNTSLSCGGCAGIAYIGVFDLPGQHEYYQPALAFSTALSGSPKLIAEVVAHEVGHNFGLQHDGNPTSGYDFGHAAWVPIMGGATGRPLSQFSDGDYAGANNQQDDLAVIASGGAPLLADDHGNSAGTATALPTADLSTGTPVTGLIGTRTDTDWFSFTTTGGPVTLAAIPAAVGADLDLRLDLLDSSGAVVATADPASSTTTTDPPSGLSASLQLPDLAAGTYFARLDGVGAGDPLGSGYSDYGSVGRYALSVTAATDGLPVTLAIVPTTLSEGTVGRPWSASLQASGGTAPYTWSVTAGQLSPGLTLAPGGTLSGTPTQAGSFTFTTMVLGGGTAIGQRTLVVRVPPRITTSALAGATRGRPYLSQLAATGGLAPYRWSRYAGTVPPGLSLSSAGRLAGTPTTSGSYDVTFRATDVVGRVAFRYLAIRVNPPPSVATSALTSARKGYSYGIRLTSSGGTPGRVWKLYAGTLPTGLRLGSTGVLSGVPSVRTSRYLTFQVTDARGAISRRTLRLVVG